MPSEEERLLYTLR